jgi:hypothetical protein
MDSYSEWLWLMDTADIQACERHGEYIETGFGCPECEYEAEGASETEEVGDD